MNHIVREIEFERRDARCERERRTIYFLILVVVFIEERFDACAMSLHRCPNCYYLGHLCNGKINPKHFCVIFLPLCATPLHRCTLFFRFSFLRATFCASVQYYCTIGEKIKTSPTVCLGYSAKIVSCVVCVMYTERQNTVLITVSLLFDSFLPVDFNRETIAVYSDYLHVYTEIEQNDNSKLQVCTI
jgi:hypothetical protein